jgi:hypothetical protein
MVGAKGFLGCMTDEMPAAKKGTLPASMAEAGDDVAPLAALYCHETGPCHTVTTNLTDSAHNFLPHL